jgi:chromosome segregation ATPase
MSQDAARLNTSVADLTSKLELESQNALEYEMQQKSVSDLRERNESLQAEADEWREKADAEKLRTVKVQMELEDARQEAGELSEQVAQLKIRAVDLERVLKEKEALEHEMGKERDRNEQLQREREHLREVARESSLAQTGLSALTDEHEILQRELQSLEQSLIQKDKVTREQQREMQRLSMLNADLEGHVQRLMSDQSNLRLSSMGAEADLVALNAQNRDALEAAAQARADLEVKGVLILKLEKQNSALEAQFSEKEQRVNDLNRALKKAQEELDSTKVRLHEVELMVKSKDTEMIATIQRKETQIIEFLQAVEMKTARKDQVSLT